MEDVKWMFRKCGFPILIFLFVVIVGTVCWEKLKTEKPQSVAEEVWEPPVEIENSEEVSVEETDTESSMESVYWFVPQSEECLITDEEKKELQSMVLSAAESVSEIYVDIVISDAPNYSSGISDFTSEQRKVVVEHLGSKGLVSVEEDTNMQNYEKIETFYAEYLDGHDSMVASVYKGYKRDKREMRGDRAEMSDFPLYLNTVAGGLDRRDQTIGGFSFVVKIYAVPVVEIIG